MMLAKFPLARTSRLPNLMVTLCRSYPGKHKKLTPRKKNQHKDNYPSQTRSNRAGFLANDIEEDLYHEDGPVVENPEQLHQEFRKEVRKLRQVMLRTVEQKHFKSPREETLLTWNAKEQIRFLHQEYPNEWTVERLAESFPITEEGVKKLLKSRFVPRTEDAILKHDRKVQERWKAIERNKSLGRPQKYIDLKFAGGNKALPSPQKKMLFLDDQSKTPSPPGKYLSIVKDYVERKERLRAVEQKDCKSSTIDQPLISEGREEKMSSRKIERKNQKTEGNHGNYGTALITQSNGNAPKHTDTKYKSVVNLSQRIDYRNLFKYKQKYTREKQEYKYHGNLLDTLQDSDVKPEMVESLPEKPMSKGDLIEKIEMYDESPQNSFEDELLWEDSQESGNQENFHSQHYTQRKSRDCDSLDLKSMKESTPMQNKDHETYLYKKDNCYYDEDGEFLFRT